jgi:hypothetical protein
MKMPKIGLGKNASIKEEYKASCIIKMPLTLPHSRVATQTFTQSKHISSAPLQNMCTYKTQLPNTCGKNTLGFKTKV